MAPQRKSDREMGAPRFKGPRPIADQPGTFLGMSSHFSGETVRNETKTFWFASVRDSVSNCYSHHNRRNNSFCTVELGNRDRRAESEL
jgi:hypothetical protein